MLTSAVRLLGRVGDPPHLRRSLRAARVRLEHAGSVMLERGPGALRRSVARDPGGARWVRRLTERLLEPGSGRATGDPAVSVVVTCRDGADWLPVALRSVQAQRGIAWECVVVDNASVDDSVEIAQRFAAGDGRFVVLVLERGAGGQVARSVAVGATRAPLVVTLTERTGLAFGALRRAVRLARRQGAARCDVIALHGTTIADAAASWLRSRPDAAPRPVVPRAAVPIEAVPDPVELRRVSGTPAPVPMAAPLAGSIVLVPEARYHVDELGPLAEELTARGFRVAFMSTPATPASALAAVGLYVDVVAEFDPVAVAGARALVVLNDWGAARELVLSARAAGVPTFGKVEGVQDFEDVDTGRRRAPYRRVDVVLAQGENDVAALADQPVEVVGSSRLERILDDPPASRGDHALINLNFTFRVLVEHRDVWIESVADALGLIGVRGVVSLHPADRRPLPARVQADLDVAHRPFRYEIGRAGVLVSRFSTVPFEAMAHGVPFVYHNPHGEQVGTFARSAGAFETSRSVDELARAVERALGPAGDDYRSTARAFLARQVDVVAGRSPSVRAADAIERRLVGARTHDVEHVSELS